MMRINIVVIAIAIIAVLAFIYFVVKRNRKDQKSMEEGFNEKEISADKHKGNKV